MNPAATDANCPGYSTMDDLVRRCYSVAMAKGNRRPWWIFLSGYTSLVARILDSMPPSIRDTATIDSPPDDTEYGLIWIGRLAGPGVLRVDMPVDTLTVGTVVLVEHYPNEERPERGRWIGQCGNACAFVIDDDVYEPETRGRGILQINQLGDVDAPVETTEDDEQISGIDAA